LRVITCFDYYLNYTTYEENASVFPDRPLKPRNSGITMVMDKGLSIREAEDFMSVGSEYTDYVKLGFGTSLITPGFEKKIALYKKAGVIPYFGGTLFEAFIIRNMFKEFVDFLDKNEIEMVEVSDGSYDIDHKRKLEYINKLTERGTVISEVGSKKKMLSILRMNGWQ
jgi:phosphosulfolactate synthase